MTPDLIRCRRGLLSPRVSREGTTRSRHIAPPRCRVRSNELGLCSPPVPSSPKNSGPRPVPREPRTRSSRPRPPFDLVLWGANHAPHNRAPHDVTRFMNDNGRAPATRGHLRPPTGCLPARPFPPRLHTHGTRRLPDRPQFLLLSAGLRYCLAAPAPRDSPPREQAPAPRGGTTRRSLPPQLPPGGPRSLPPAPRNLIRPSKSLSPPVPPEHRWLGSLLNGLRRLRAAHPPPRPP